MTAFSNVANAAFWTEAPHIRQLVLVVFDLTIAAMYKDYRYQKHITLCNLYYELSLNKQTFRLYSNILYVSSRLKSL